MNSPRRLAGFVAAIVALALVLNTGPGAHAQPPIRIGASLSKTGAYGVPGQNQLRGYQLCIKHVNETGGLLGRRLELVVEDDHSEPTVAVRIYEKHITQDKVNALLGPYTSPIADAVAEVSEKHRMVLVDSGAAANAIFKKGRKFLFMVLSPGEVYLDGFVELAAQNGVKTLALIYEDSPFTRAVVKGASELARKRGVQLVFTEAYPGGTTDFSAILTKARSTSPDALGAATRGLDAAVVTRQMKEVNLNPRMYVATVGAGLPDFYKRLGPSAEFVYGSSQWEPELVTLRAGGLIPIACQHPGAREFVEAHQREYPGADLSYHTAAGYAGCQVLTEAVRRAGSLDNEKIRDVIRKLDFNTVFGAFKVDQDGFQIAHRMVLFQWQDGKKVIVWPQEVAPGKPRFPTPPWNQRQ